MPSPPRRAPSPVRAISPPRSRSKKYYESDTVSDATESEIETDTRSSRRQRDVRRYEESKYEGPKYESSEHRRRRESSPDDTKALSRSSKYSSDRYREEEYRPSHEEAGRYEPARPAEYTRHMSYTRPDEHGRERNEHREYAPPGSYRPEYDERDRRDHPPETTRHMSISTPGGFHMDVGHGHQQNSYHPTSPPAQPPPQAYYPNQPQHPMSPGSQQPPQPYYTPNPVNPDAYRPQYQAPQKYQYANPSHEIQYRSKSDIHAPKYTATPHAQIEVERKRFAHAEAPPKEVVKVERKPSHSHRHDKEYIEIHPGGGSLHAPPSPGLGPRMHRLSVSGGASGGMTLSAPGMHHHQPGAAPPGSPLLEAYHGTYQSISPMPSPLALPAHMDDGLSDLEPLEPEFDSDDSHHRRPKKSILKKRVSIYDPEPDALAIAAQLKHTKPNAEPLIHILPRLSDDNMMALRTEYKKHFKVNGKGINIAKHIKLKVTGNVGKIAYATALGRWESEAHWANFWYQSGSSRRELLIESLMGRSNAEIRKIKEAFSDKRYGDSLERCMQTELKKDKFRNAILLALEEKRGDELEKVSKTRVKADVDALYKALVAKDGGETAMIEIIVVRSDAHLREVLRDFEGRYRRNFGREMIQKSQNLVVSLYVHTHTHTYSLSLSLCLHSTSPGGTFDS